MKAMASIFGPFWAWFLVGFDLKIDENEENIVLRSLIWRKYRIKTLIFYDFWRIPRNTDIYGTSGLTLTPFWRPRAKKHRYLRWISAWAKTCTIKELEARQWGSVSLHVSDWRFWGACGHEAVGAGKCKSIMTPRVWEHESIRAWCHANRISRSYGAKRAQEHKSSISREPDAMRPLPQWYEITECERQIIKYQERERMGPRASEREIKRPERMRGARKP